MVKDYNNVLDFVNNYDKGKFVYPSVIKRHFGINGHEVYNVLEELVRSGILQRVYKIQCIDCGYTNEVIYQSLNEIEDDDMICHSCRGNLHILQDTIMFYKKL